jgi:hypothetical protein
MNAKHSLLRWLTLIAIVPMALAFLTGCPGGDDGITPTPGLETDETLIVENGLQPVWVNEESFLFNYESDTGIDGIFWSDLDGNVTEVYPGIHNYDYVASPSGDYAAFSTPDLDGGVYFVELNTPVSDPVLLLEGGTRPSFISDDMVVMENEVGNFGMVELSFPLAFFGYAEGGYPISSADGSKVAYIFSVTGSGFQIRYLDRQGLDIFNLVTNVGIDHVWHPDGSYIYVSQLTDGTLTNVIEIPVADPEGFSTLISGATRPSISRDGIHLFADNVDAGVSDGIVYRNLETGRVESIRNAQRPAAAFSGRALLAEKFTGIFLITFE